MKDCIIIEDLCVHDKIIQVNFSVSNNVEKYFLENQFTVEYDTKIDKVPKSILYIPIISSIITVAWMAGADIYVEELDETYIKSINRVKKVIRGWHPELPFSDLYVDKPALNRIDNNDNYGLLFSGGLDSMTSYIRNKEKKPRLIHCVVRKEHMNAKLDNLINFARKEDVHLSIIRSNVYNIINNLFIFTKFGLFWWPNLAHAIIYTGLCAPLSAASGIRTLLIASSDTERYDGGPWGSHPMLDNNIEWAGCNVHHDGYDLSRQEKIRYALKPYLENIADKDHILKALDLQCGLSPADRNIDVCQECMQKGKGPKCIRNILGLSLENIDPNSCGFNIRAESFSLIKKCFLDGLCVKNKIFTSTKANSIGEISEMIYFKDIQDHIPEHLINDKYNSLEFFEWFKNYDLNSYEPKIKPIEYSSMLLATLAFKMFPLYCDLPRNKIQARLLRAVANLAYKKARF